MQSELGVCSLSVVIHRGIVFRKSDLGSAYALLESFAPRIAALTADDLASFLADLAIRKLDAFCAGGPDDGVAPLSAAWDQIDEGQRAERQGYRHPLTDFEFRVDLFPHQADVLGIVRTERREWLAALLKELSPAVTGYAYWDNTDPPDGMPEAEWQARGKAWEDVRTAMRGRNVGGCAVDLSTMLFPPEPESIMAKVPDLAKRIARTAKDRGVEHFLAAEAGFPGLDTDQRIRAVMRAPDWLRSEAGRAWVSAEGERLKGVLIHDVQFEDLRRAIAVQPGAPRP